MLEFKRRLRWVTSPQLGSYSNSDIIKTNAIEISKISLSLSVSLYLSVLFRSNYIMNAAIKNPSYNKIDAAFKNLNISSKEKNKNESITSDELFLFKLKILQAIEYIREKRKRPDTNAIYEHLKKTEASNIDKETIDNIISELINQKILENKKSTYGDSFRLITGKEKDTLDEITSPDNIDKIDKNDNQSDPGIKINAQPFTYRNENDITQEISPIREPVINLDVHNPLAQPIREMEPVTNPDLHTPSQSNQKDHFQHDQQQIIPQISALKSHLKCEVSTMNSRKDLLSEVIENKINVLSDQCKNIEVLQDKKVLAGGTENKE